MGDRKKPSRYLLEITVPIALIVVWWFAGEVGLHSFYFPTLRDISRSFAETWLFERVGADVVPTLSAIALGYAVSVIAGVAVGLALGTMPRVHEFFTPLLDFFRALPSSAAVPIFIVLIGAGMSMKIAVVMFAALWTIVLNTSDAVASVDPVVRETSLSYHLRPWDRLVRVVLPSAAPQIVAGMRVALNQSIIMVIISEIIASSAGIGYYIENAQWTYNITGMWSGLLLIGIIGFVLNKVFQLFEYRVLAWHRGLHRKAQS